MSEMVELTEYELDQVTGGTMADVYSFAFPTALGAAIGFAVAGPPGAVVGAVAGAMVGAVLVANNHAATGTAT